MINKSPSMEIWKKLYQTAIDFSELKPWDWMFDRDLFGVEDPNTGEVGYCCVMGRLGEHFALALYRGSRGLSGYIAIATAGNKRLQDPALILGSQDCLMASFEDRRMLEKDDLQIIKELGLKFRGSNGWPLFRSYEPGKPPWHIIADEADWLTHALNQTIEMAKRVKVNSGLLRPKGKSLLIRVAEKQDGAIIWSDQWKNPKLERAETIVLPALDLARLQQIKDKKLVFLGTWEVDYEYNLTPVRDKERPYFPVMFLVVHHDTEFIINGELVASEDLAALQEIFLKTIEQSGIPRQVWIKKPQLAEILTPIAEQLNFDLLLAKQLNVVAKVRRHMKRFFH